MKSLVVEKEIKLKKHLVELERTQKSMKMMNLWTYTLDYILTLGKSKKAKEDLDLLVRQHSDQRMYMLKALSMLLLQQ